MKTVYLSFIFLISIISNKLNAQVSIAPNMGVNISKSLFTEYFFPTKYSTYFYGGAIVKYNISEKLAIQTALQYSQKGYHKEAGDFEVLLPEVRYSYLDIQPTIEFKVIDFIGIYGGINYGIKLKEEYKFPGSDWFNGSNNKTIKDYDFGGLLGIRYYYNNFFINAQYNQSFLNISTLHFTDAQGNEKDYASQKNSTFQFGVGYFFRL
ncbi:MAG TPA: outer membrane beta-barrel protein [Saprospiraceae bacterium]|nr:outer membrane beta-barrel protein [Saprospiraceae bacterium]